MQLQRSAKNSKTVFQCDKAKNTNPKISYDVLEQSSQRVAVFLLHRDIHHSQPQTEIVTKTTTEWTETRASLRTGDDVDRILH